MRCALVEAFLGQAVEKRDQRRDRILGAVWVSDVALNAAKSNIGREAAAAADLDHVAEGRFIRRLADEAMVDGLAVCLQPLENGKRAVDGGAFLVASDQ